MTAREWEPGAVAMVQCSDGEWRRAHMHSGVWVFADNTLRRVDDSIARPLVVIDPEDREQVERLADLFTANHHSGQQVNTASEHGVRSMQAALREFANPKPAKPKEPTGLGAVVFASCDCVAGRKRFVRDDTGSEFPDSPWKAGCGHHTWADLDVRDEDDLLSEGVTS